MRSPAPIVLFGILVVGLLLRCLYFVGIGGFDDVSYLKYVAEILNGTFSTGFVFNGEFPFRYRAGILYPTALMYKVFGPSEYVAAALPLVVSMATIWLAFRAGQLFSPLVAVLAALLMATLPIAVVSATSLLPTLFSAFFCGLSIVWWIELEGLHLSRADWKSKATAAAGSLRYRKYFAVGVLLGVAYLFRVEAAISGAVFIVFSLIWLRPNRAWIVAAIGILLVLAAENLVYYSLHGEWFYRLKMISRGFAEVASSGGTGSPIKNAKSPMVYIDALFLKPIDFGLHGAALVAAAVGSLFLVGNSAVRPILIWFWVWLLYLSFGSWSLDTYVPTTKNPRYLQNVVVPGVVLLAFVIAWLIEKRGAIRWLAWAGLCGIMFGSAVLINPAWVYRYENAAGSRIAAQMIRAELASSGVDIESQVIQAEYYTAANLSPFLPEVEVAKLSHADIGRSDSGSQFESAIAGFVIYDSFIANKYKDAVGYQPPPEFINPPANWELITSQPRPVDRFQYRVVALLSIIAGGRIAGFENSLQDWDLLIYKVYGK